MNQFNRVFRVLWSKTKAQWVVVSELEGAGGKKQGKGVVSVFCAALVVAGMLTATPQQVEALIAPTGSTFVACTGNNVTNSAVLASPSNCIATATDTLTNASTGVLKDSRAWLFASSLITVDAAATGVSINNAGTLLARRRPVVNVNAAARGTTIVNQVGANISMTTPNRSLLLFGAGSFDVNTSLTNAGTIQIKQSTNTNIPIKILGNMAGQITNTSTGTILAQGTSSGTMDYRTISIGGDLSGTLTNHGSISAVGIHTSNNSVPFARGIMAASLSGLLNNSGSVTASMTVLSSAAQAHALGIDITGNASGSLINTSTGTIDAYATVINSRSRAQATGVGIGTLATGVGLSNGNRISATAKVSTTVCSTLVRVTNNMCLASAYGVHIASFAGKASNTGNISAHATGSQTKEHATGVRIDSMAAGALLTNSGTISSSTNKASNITNAYALNILAAIGGTVSNNAGGVFKGNIATPAGLTMFNNAGTIEIPDGVTNASIAGSYAQQAGGKLTIGASSAASYAKLATGPANLIAGSVIDVYTTPGNTLAVGDTLLGVFTSTALTAGVLTVTDNSNTLDFKPVINGNQIDLNVVVADLTPPVITLNGASNITIAQGATFTDPGATVTDNVDTGLTATVTGTVDTATPNTYTLTYTAADTAGNAAVPVIRTVTVTAAPSTQGPYASSSGGRCLAPTGSGLLPMLMTLFAGLGLSRRRKK